jgi:hypothetical protein
MLILLKKAIFTQIHRQKNARNAHVQVVHSAFCAVSSLPLQKSYFLQWNHDS